MTRRTRSVGAAASVLPVPVEFGPTPKEAARVLRFKRSSGLLRATPPRPLADVAAVSSYYDQAHMARDGVIWSDVHRPYGSTRSSHPYKPEEVLVVPGEDGVVVHAELRWPEGGGVMFGVRRGRVCLKPGQSSVYVVTDRPDEMCEGALAAGTELDHGIRDEDYGSQGFTVRDPEGNLWSFGTHRGLTSRSAKLSDLERMF